MSWHGSTGGFEFLPETPLNSIHDDEGNLLKSEMPKKDIKYDCIPQYIFIFHNNIFHDYNTIAGSDVSPSIFDTIFTFLDVR